VQATVLSTLLHDHACLVLPPGLSCALALTLGQSFWHMLCTLRCAVPRHRLMGCYMSIFGGGCWLHGGTQRAKNICSREVHGRRGVGVEGVPCPQFHSLVLRRTTTCG
jgi:hypothetical protein